MTKERIALRGQVYATPKTESVEIVNQGVLCASALQAPVSSSGISKITGGGTF